MKKKILFYVILLFLFGIKNESCSAKVIQMINFNLKNLQLFSIGTDQNIIESNNKIKKFIYDSKVNKQIIKYLLVKNTYKIKVFIQFFNKRVEDSITVFPQYFLHDVLLHSLIKKYGKIYTYKKISTSAMYQWKSNQKIILYNATCTITCFPIYLYKGKLKKNVKLKRLTEIIF